MTGQQYQAISILNLGAMFGITALFIYGSRMLSKKIDQKQQSTRACVRVQPTKKIKACSQMVAVNSFGFSLACTLYAIFASHESLGIVALLCSVLAVTHALILHLSILNYLGGAEIFKVGFAAHKYRVAAKIKPIEEKQEEQANFQI